MAPLGGGSTVFVHGAALRCMPDEAGNVTTLPRVRQQDVRRAAAATRSATRSERLSERVTRCATDIRFDDRLAYTASFDFASLSPTAASSSPLVFIQLQRRN